MNELIEGCKLNRHKTYTRKLTINFEVFPEDNITVLTVAEGKEAINMFEGEKAVEVMKLLTTVKEEY